MLQSIKLFFVGFLLLVNMKWFIFIGKFLFPDDFKDEHLIENVKESSTKFRHALFYSFKFNFFIFLVALAFIFFIFRDAIFIRYNLHPSLIYIDIIKISAAFLALTVTLGRGGWSIQTWKGNSLAERIDKGMYKLIQYINVIIFLLLMYWPT